MAHFGVGNGPFQAVAQGVIGVTCFFQNLQHNANIVFLKYNLVSRID